MKLKQNQLLAFDEYPDIVDTDELCQMLGGINKKIVQRMLRNKKIPSFRIGRLYKVVKVHVIDYILHRTTPLDSIVLFADYPATVTTDVLCQMLGGICKWMALTLLHEKKIYSIRIGGVYYIAKEDIIAFVLKST